MAAAPAAVCEPKAGVLLSRPRRAFGAPVAFVDAHAADLWASNTMEARPFKDANYDLRRAQMEAGVQAVPRLQESAVQVCSCTQLLAFWPAAACGTAVHCSTTNAA